MTTRIEYRGCTLSARPKGHGAEGVALHVGEELARVAGGSVEHVFELLRHSVDDLHVIDRGNGQTEYPTTARYVTAFKALSRNMPDGYVSMLRAHFNASDRTLTATEIASAANYIGHRSANLHYGEVARRVADFLFFTPRLDTRGKPIWTFMLATGDETMRRNGEWLWKMRDAVAEALSVTGIVP